MTSTGDDSKHAPALSDIIDTAHLARYTMGDVKLERELLGMFDAQLEELLAALEAAREDVREWKLAAHTLKGAARAVGAFSLAETALALEKEGPSVPDALMERLRRQADDFRKAWKHWLEVRSGDLRRAG